MIEQTLQAIFAAIGILFSVLFYTKYKEGRSAVDKLNRQTDEKKLNDFQKTVYKKYDSMSLDELSDSSGKDDGTGIRRGDDTK